MKEKEFNIRLGKTLREERKRIGYSIYEGNRWMLCICSAKSDKYALLSALLDHRKGYFFTNSYQNSYHDMERMPMHRTHKKTADLHAFDHLQQSFRVYIMCHCTPTLPRLMPL